MVGMYWTSTLQVTDFLQDAISSLENLGASDAHQALEREKVAVEIL